MNDGGDLVSAHRFAQRALVANVAMEEGPPSHGGAVPGPRARQNFKLVDWRAVKAALRL